MFNDYKNAISSQRLESYRRNGYDDLDTLSRYLWNTSLCEAFYPSLQSLEIGLRNAIHGALTFCRKNSLWFKESFMCDKCAEDVEEAENELTSKGKDHTNAGRIVAELKFGFWTRLFNKHYQIPLWNNKTFLYRTFPHATAQQRVRHHLSVKIDNIRRFRNRVFHHESILSHKLPDQYNEIIEITHWINPTLVKASVIIDRFPEIASQRYFEELKRRIAATLMN